MNLNRSLLARGGVSLVAAGSIALAGCGQAADSPTALPTPTTSPEVTSAPAGPATSEQATADPTTVAPETSEEAAAPAAPVPGAVDLAFTATTLDGETFDGASLAGKPALLWFWAPWCPTCAGQAAHMSEVADTYAGEIAVVGVGGLDQADAMRGFVEERGVGNFTHVADEAGAVWQRFGITAQSTYVVLDADGMVVAEGNLSQSELDDSLASVAG